MARSDKYKVNGVDITSSGFTESQAGYFPPVPAGATNHITIPGELYRDTSATTLETVYFPASHSVGRSLYYGENSQTSFIWGGRKSRYYSNLADWGEYNIPLPDRSSIKSGGNISTFTNITRNTRAIFLTREKGSSHSWTIISSNASVNSCLTGLAYDNTPNYTDIPGWCTCIIDMQAAGGNGGNGESVWTIGGYYKFPGGGGGGGAFASVGIFVPGTSVIKLSIEKTGACVLSLNDNPRVRVTAGSAGGLGKDPNKGTGGSGGKVQIYDTTEKDWIDASRGESVSRTDHGATVVELVLLEAVNGTSGGNGLDQGSSISWIDSTIADGGVRLNHGQSDAFWTSPATVIPSSSPTSYAALGGHGGYSLTAAWAGRPACIQGMTSGRFASYGGGGAGQSVSGAAGGDYSANTPVGNTDGGDAACMLYF